MAWRKWLVRSLVFSALGLGALGALLYEVWTNPAAVRRQVIDKLARQFVGATVSVESARMRLLGGIAVRDLRMARRDELDRGDLLYVPSAVIYHDKEHLLDGTLAVRKIELDRPRLRVVRERDGRVNLSGLLSPPDLTQRVPTVVIRRGTVLVEDRSGTAGATLLEIKDVNLTLTNDPLPTLTLEGAGQTDALGPVQFRARLHRATDAAGAVVELPQVPVGPHLVERLEGLCPDVVRHVRELSGTGKVRAGLSFRPDAAQPWGYDVECRLSDGAWNHDCLPVPLEQIEASLRCVNGRVPFARLQARSGPATVDVKLWGLAWAGRRPDCVEQVAKKIEARVDQLVITPEFFDRLPPACKAVRRLYAPAGPARISYDYNRNDGDRWKKRWRIEPQGMSAEFEHFRYPIGGLTGSVVVDLAGDREDQVTIDLTGRAAGKPVTIKGAVRGARAEDVDIVVNVEDLPIDQQLLLALPEKSRALTRTFLPGRSRELGLIEQPLGQTKPAGLADIKAYIRRPRGQKEFANRYVIGLHDAGLRYDQFPLPLEGVSGVLDIQPDHWECQNFHGSHKGGQIWVNACSYRVDAAEARDAPPLTPHPSPPSGGRGEKENTLSPPGGRGQGEGGSGAPRPQRECVQVGIRGQDIPLDREFEEALSPPDSGRAALRNAWAMLALRGRLSFESVVVDRPDQPQDIDVAVDLKGCTMQPEFFRYAMTDVCAGVRYAHGRVYVKDVSARHGACRLGLKEATIVLKPAGGFQAWFQGIRGTDLPPDEEFLRALHPAMRRALEPLQLRKPVAVETSLTLDAPAVPGEPMKIWWDGGVALRDQVFQAGVEIDGVDGTLWCHGHHNGRQFEGVSGHALFRRARILGQPFTDLQGRIEIAPETPDVLSLYDLKANLFGGFVGGEARFTFASPLRYEVKLDALHVQLDQFGRHNNLGRDAQLQGPARAALHLTGEGTDLSGLKGNGRVEVANGKLYRLPLLLDLLKAFGLRMPDRTAFEQARMLFALEGPQMRVHGLDLYGSAISLRGQGTVNLDGSNVNLDFAADWGRLPQMLPGPLSDVTQSLSDQLFKIKVRGKLSSPRFEKELMPVVVDPIKKALGATP